MAQDKHNSEVRIPRQQRSRDRVEAILEAAKALIGQKGSAGLKIHEIAAEAGVTAGSMYQYFPNKAAILQALARQYFDHFHAVLKEALEEPPTDLATSIELLHSLFDQFYEVNCEDPVLRDIWLSISVDKTMRDMDISSSKENASLLFETMKPLFPQEQWPALRRYFLLVVHITPPAIRLALSAGPEESRAYVDATKQMIAASMTDCVAK